jgi:hypothetical protein
VSDYGAILSVRDPLFSSKSRTRRWTTMPIGVEGRPDRPLLRLITTPFWRRSPRRRAAGDARSRLLENLTC